jgi:hypothetical protein
MTLTSRAKAWALVIELIALGAHATAFPEELLNLG